MVIPKAASVETWSRISGWVIVMKAIDSSTTRFWRELERRGRKLEPVADDPYNSDRLGPLP